MIHKDTSPQTHINWYETSLPLKERRSKGHFSTPPALVEQILDACGYTPNADLSTIRVLDPACGSGNFLAAAARRLLNHCELAQLAPEMQITLLQHNIWGFDPDPISCFLAEMQFSVLPGRNSLRPYDFRPHIHQGDALALPWHEPCVDLFLANPPYLASKNTDLSSYRATQRGQTDSYLLFLNLGLRIVRPNAWLGLVVPDPLLARANPTLERTRLLHEYTVHHLWHLDAVFPAHVGAVVLIAQKCSPHSTHAITWIRNKWPIPVNNELTSVGAGLPQPTADLSARPLCPPSGLFLETSSPSHNTTETLNIKHDASTIPQALLARQPHAEFRYLLSREPGSFIEHLRSYLDEDSKASHHFAPLRNFLSIRRGEELGQSSPHLLHNSHKPDALTQEDQEWYPVLRGGRDVRPYAITFNDRWIARKAIVKPLARYLSPKLLVVKSTDRLQAALDTHGHVALQTLYLLQLCQANTHEDDLYFYLALLNSRLLQMYTYMLHTAYKWVQPQIEQHVLARLPVPLVSIVEKQPIIERAKLLSRSRPCDDTTPVVEWREHTKQLYAEQERAIRTLYDAAIP
jgi:SAM-dependent methyltransferase